MQYRKFISIFLSLSFLILIFSGIVLYIMPHGRVAYWTDWRFLGLNKDNWSDIHTIYSLIFIILSLFHLYFNWKPILNYFQKNLKEVAVSIFLTFIIFLGTMYSVAPFKTVTDFGEKIKSSWNDNKIAPKIPHGELLPLKKLCKRLNINIETAMRRLKNKNIKINNAKEKIKDIAKNNHLKPIEIYFIIINKK